MPPKQLRGFARLTLKPGETLAVSTPLAAEDLAVWSTVDGKWVAVSGQFTVMVGASAADLRLSGSFTVPGTNTALSNTEFERERASNAPSNS
jgi:beta-glucosidase